MTTLPSGAPIWSGRSASAGTYGATLNLHDYGNIGAVNANTDITAAQYKRMASDSAACALTQPIMILGVSNVAAVIQIDYVLCPWAPLLRTPYVGTAPPSAVYPRGELLGTGLALITLPTSATDEFGVTADVSIFTALPMNGLVTLTEVVTAYSFGIDGIDIGVSTGLLVF